MGVEQLCSQVSELGSVGHTAGMKLGREGEEGGEGGREGGREGEEGR